MTRKLIHIALLTAAVLLPACSTQDTNEPPTGLAAVFNPILHEIGETAEAIEHDLSDGYKFVDKKVRNAELPSLEKEPEVVVDPNQLLTEAHIAADLGYRIHWQVNILTPPGVQILSLTQLNEELIAIVESNNLLTLLDASSGRVRWRSLLATPASTLSKPHLDGEDVVIFSESVFYRLRLSDGSTISETRLSNMSQDKPLLIDNNILTGTPTGLVFSQSTRTGHVRWRYQMNGASLTPLVQTRNSIIATDAKGTLAALIPSTGKLLWRRFQPPWGRVSATPLYHANTLYVACEDQKLYAFNPSTGDVNWAFIAERPLTDAPVVFRDDILQRIPGKGIVAIDSVTGVEKWRSPVMADPVELRGNRLHLVDGNLVTVLDFNTGRKIEQVAFFRADRVVTSDATDADVFLINRDGRILKLGSR